MNKTKHLVHIISIAFFSVFLATLTTNTYAEISVGSTSQQSGGIDPISLNHNLLAGNNRAVVVGVSIEAKGLIGRATDITYGGVAMHAIPNSLASIQPGNYSNSTELFYLLESELPVVGSKTIQIVHNGNDISAGVVQLNGVRQTGVEGVATNAASYPASISTSITTLTANALLLDVVGGGSSSGQLQASTNQTSFWVKSAPSSKGSGSRRLLGAAGNYTQQWNTSNMNRVAHSVIAFAPIDGSSPTNQAPVLNTINNQSVQVGSSKTVAITATDADGDTLSFSALSLPSYVTLTDNGNNTASLVLTPQTGDVDSSITVQVTDGTNGPSSRTLSITVTPKDSDDNNTGATETISLGASAQQSGGTAPVSTSHRLQSGNNRIVVLGASIEASGHIGRATSVTYGGVIMHPVANSLASIQPGSFSISTELFYLLDSELPVSGNKTVLVTHNGDNINVGILQLNGIKQSEAEAVATHATSGSSSLITSINTLTANAILLDVAGGGHPVGRGLLLTSVNQNSFWSVSASSSQGGGSTRQVAAAGNYTQQWNTIGMNRTAHSVIALAPASDDSSTPVNQPPVLSSIADQTVLSTTQETINIAATDPNGNTTLSLALNSAPSFVTLVDNGNGTGVITIQPVSSDVGTYTVNVVASDGALQNTTSFSLIVNSDSTGETIVQPSTMTQLNDTGMLLGEDGSTGRDVTNNDDTNGFAGFDFTKIDALGGVATSGNWSCVKDNVTGLIWEGKTTDGGLHDKNEKYTWYDPSTAATGFPLATQSLIHSQGTNNTCIGFDSANSSTYCNTQAYVNRVNTVGWCGASDWRLPTREELRSLLKMDDMIKEDGNPAIDTNYFPNTVSSYKVDCADKIYSVIPATLRNINPTNLTDDEVATISGYVGALRVDDADFGSHCQTYSAETYRHPNQTRPRGIGYATSDTGPEVRDALWTLFFDDKEIDHEISFHELKYIRLVRGTKMLDSSTPTARFVDHQNGTVTDSLTGLTWKRCLEGYEYNNNNCTPVDTKTFTWNEALQKTGLSYAGSSNWRVPNLKELTSITAYTTSFPAINENIFPNTLSRFTWSSTPHTYSNQVWAVSFSNGGDRVSDKVTSRPVRMVRD
ncbi:MAG: DUF1566 domain-containing protein [Thiotrichaceae bacterium]